MYDAYWDWYGADDEASESDYQTHCWLQHKQIREGQEAAFRAELEQLCDRFWPRSRSKERTVTVRNARQQLTWSNLTPTENEATELSISPTPDQLQKKPSNGEVEPATAQG